MGFRDIALPLIQRGIPIIPLKPRSKIAILPEWEKLATTDINQIEKWNEQYPDANAACVAKASLGSVFFLEVDKPEVTQRIETETGQKIPRTFRVRSSPGRGHFYFKNTNASLAAGNIAQGYVKNADWSARINNQYCVSPGSLHPNTGLPYEVVSEAEIIEIPDWLVTWMIGQKITPKEISIDGNESIPYGAHDTILTKIAGKFRRMGMERNSLTDMLIEICEKRCINYGADYKEMCAKIATSICRYPVVDESDTTFLLNGKPVGINAPTPTTTIGIWQPPVIVEEEAPKIEPVPYPKFPKWVMEGTSIYDGLAKPYCAVNSRYPEYMFMPAMALMLNSIALTVKLDHNKNMIPSLFMVLIGKKGRVIKSSSVQDAISYMQYAGLVDHANSSISNANGKVLVWQAGSPEGLGLDMARTNCRNAVLFYDELSTLTNKAGIESSTLSQALLTTYESGKFSNTIKGRKETYSFDPGTYCMSLIACSTDKSFLPHWAKLAGKTSGMDDRFFFLYQPEQFIPKTPPISVDIFTGAAETRKRIDKAVKQGIYKIFDKSPLNQRADDLSNRAEIRAEKFALYFAVDLGRDEIDEDCIERALALVDYEKGVKKMLSTYEGSTKEASVQMELCNMLRRNGGRMTMRDIERKMHPERYGTSLWGYAYIGLIKMGWIKEYGMGSKGDPKIIVLMRLFEDEDEE